MFRSFRERFTGYEFVLRWLWSEKLENFVTKWVFILLLFCFLDPVIVVCMIDCELVFKVVQVFVLKLWYKLDEWTRNWINFIEFHLDLLGLRYYFQRCLLNFFVLLLKNQIEGVVRILSRWVWGLNTLIDMWLYNCISLGSLIEYESVWLQIPAKIQQASSLG